MLNWTWEKNLIAIIVELKKRKKKREKEKERTERDCYTRVDLIGRYNPF